MKMTRLKHIAEAIRDDLRERRLEQMAEEVLNEEGVATVTAHLATHEVALVKEYLFSAVDVGRARELITEARARELYAILGFSPSQAEQLHQMCYEACGTIEASEAWKEHEEKHRRFDPHRKIH